MAYDTRMDEFEKAAGEDDPKDIIDYSGENVIEWLRGDKVVTLTLANNTRLCNKVKKMAEEYPDEVKIAFLNSDGSIVAKLPLNFIHISKHSGREMTPEQKAAVRERLMKARNVKKKEDAGTGKDN